MHEPYVVGRREPTAGREQQREALLEGVLAVHPTTQRRACDVLHDQVYPRLTVARVEDPDVVDCDHVGMGEAGQRPGLTQESLVVALRRAADSA